MRPSRALKNISKSSSIFYIILFFSRPDKSFGKMTKKRRIFLKKGLLFLPFSGKIVKLIILSFLLHC